MHINYEAEFTKQIIQLKDPDTEMRIIIFMVFLLVNIVFRIQYFQHALLYIYISFYVSLVAVLLGRLKNSLNGEFISNFAVIKLPQCVKMLMHVR